MFAVRHHPELVTPELRAYLRPFVRYDGDGRGCRTLADDRLPPELADAARAVAPGVAFSGVVLQCYRDGAAVTPCHTDHGITGFSFILSLGAARTFRIHRVGPGASGCGDYYLDALTVECVEGTALLMDGSTDGSVSAATITTRSRRTRPSRRRS